jgi:hypothetical protein
LGRLVWPGGVGAAVLARADRGALVCLVRGFLPVGFEVALRSPAVRAVPGLVVDRVIAVAVNRGSDWRSHSEPVC